jgi:hypothetical protein
LEIGGYSNRVRPRNLLLCVVVLVAGCGGEESPNDGQEQAAKPTATATATAATMPADEWARRVEELCREHSSRVDRESVELLQEVQSEDISHEEMLARVFERSAELTEPMLDEISALPLPEGKEREAKDFDKQMRASQEEVKALANDLRGGDGDLMRSSQEISDAVLPARASARELNIDACNPKDETLDIK